MSAVFRTLDHAPGDHRPPLQFTQLEFDLDRFSRPALSGRFGGRDAYLELQARELLRLNGANRIAAEVRVEWDPRLKSSAGRADHPQKLILLNPRLREHGAAEIERTFRHELAHVLAQFRAGRRRILPHGSEWREACRNLGIADEKRCHNLPLPTSERPRRFVYKCPNCQRDFPRAYRIRRAIACLACCRVHNGGEFDPRFRLRLAAISVAAISDRRTPNSSRR
jgi:SprT protein